MRLSLPHRRLGGRCLLLRRWGRGLLHKRVDGMLVLVVVLAHWHHSHSHADADAHAHGRTIGRWWRRWTVVAGRTHRRPGRTGLECLIGLGRQGLEIR